MVLMMLMMLKMVMMALATDRRSKQRRHHGGNDDGADQGRQNHLLSVGQVVYVAGMFTNGEAKITCYQSVGGVRIYGHAFKGAKLLKKLLSVGRWYTQASLQRGEAKTTFYRSVTCT